MPEILTESFCERCGTRYTFESVAPRKTRRIGQFKTLSRGVKNWVMSDDSSLDEALAAARSDEEREVTAQQLDAFHSTFNFCMNCRQYTCANCWNPAEGRCLSCAPNLGEEILLAAFPDATQFEPVRMTDAWPEADLAGPAAAADGLGLAGLPANGRNGQDDLAGGNGHIDVADEPSDTEALAAGEFGDDVPDVDALARLAFLTGEPAPEAGAEPVAEPEPADIQAAPEAAAPSDAADNAESPAPPEVLAEPTDVDDRAAELAARTSQLLGRFRPGQNIDAELAAYEAELEAQDAARETPVTEEVVAPAAATPVAADRAVTAEPDAVAVAEEQQAEEPQAAEPPAAVVAPEDEAAVPAAAAAEGTEAPAAAEPTADVAASPASDEPAGGSPAPREDRIEQPTWRIFAPEPTATPVDQPVPPAMPGQVPVQASGEPEWPARPEFGESPSMALLAERARASSDAMWAASTREVLAGPPRSGPAAAAAPAGVQPCSNCGLSLSATARFCRRCGTRQG